MLKSTYKPSANLLASKSPPLPPGWTEHKAPTGHTYYYKAETKESTYKRPGVPDAPASGTEAHAIAGAPYGPALPRLSDPRVANAFLAAQNPRPRPQTNEGQARDSRPKPQPVDKPRSKEAIPGCEPWILVYTKYGRRFAYNPDKKASYWRIPDKLKPAILELDKARIKEKANSQSQVLGANDAAPGAAPRPKPTAAPPAKGADEEESSEYEELEVTDEEDGDDNDVEDGREDGEDNHRAKRQRTEDAEMADAEMMDPEAEMLYQLQMMNSEHQGDQGDYDDETQAQARDADEVDEAPISEEDAGNLFRDMLNDFNISPYSPWEKLLEDGNVFDDARYTVLPTTKARKEVWDTWCKDKIKELKEIKAKEEKPDPKVVYMEFLARYASPKLFWPEFKRKHRKEACMKDFALADKDREKWYREYVQRLKLPQSTLKADLATLMRSLPLSVLNRATSTAALPRQLRGDVRYVSLPPETTQALIRAYVQTLGPPPDGGAADDGGEEAAAAKKRAMEARRKRERALEERNKALAEQKARDERNLEMAKARLRQGELEVQRAMQLDRKGLQSQLE